jgi:hypothetical protein
MEKMLTLGNSEDSCRMYISTGRDEGKEWGNKGTDRCPLTTAGSINVSTCRQVYQLYVDSRGILFTHWTGQNIHH